MAKEYKVRALSVGGRNNKIFKAGDIVTADAFSVNVNDLVKQGFLEPISRGSKVEDDSEFKPEPSNNGVGSEEDVTASVAAAADVSTSEEDNAEEDNSDAGSVKIPEYDDITKDRIMVMLEDTGLVRNKDFKKNQSKTELYDMLVKKLS